MSRDDSVQKPPSVFLCHSHRDKRFAHRVSRDLWNLGISVWIDAWKLEVGDSLHTCIGKALEDSAYIAVLLSPDSLSSRWCQDELEQALAREKRAGRKLVLPLLRRRVTPPPFLEGRLYLDFSLSYWNSLAVLAGLLHELNQQALAENVRLGRPRDLNAVRRILERSGLAPGITVPAKDYRHLMRIFKQAGAELPGDRARFMLPDSKSFVLFLDDMPGGDLFPIATEKPVSKQLKGKTRKR